MTYFKFEVFIPKENSKKLIDELNKNSLLIDGPYDYVFAATEVLGHFRPLEDSNPFIGEKMKIEEVKELKLEFRIKSENKDKTFRIIKENHPYEIPVINIIPLEN
ncbi:divalent cation tolerance protein CutA [Peptoniphilus raoultii]|uniref:divalent cation tolerance protein CutA n=1 Tax=Peptoniphilus raoultii TaxID=1776387 RepID=UPI0008D91959|nr:divalent cation tolerance protein CutA [Peptoniphilus raoultii]